MEGAQLLEGKVLSLLRRGKLEKKKKKNNYLCKPHSGLVNRSWMKHVRLWNNILHHFGEPSRKTRAQGMSPKGSGSQGLPSTQEEKRRCEDWVGAELRPLIWGLEPKQDHTLSLNPCLSGHGSGWFSHLWQHHILLSQTLSKASLQ